MALPEGTRDEEENEIEAKNEDDEKQSDAAQIATSPMVNGNPESKESSVADKVGKSVAFAI